MKVAIIGSRGLSVENLEAYLSAETTEIVSGGARGIDSSARQYAQRANLPIKEFLPDYSQYGRRAPLVRNEEIVRYADHILAFWDGKSRGTMHVINTCRKLGKPYQLFCLERRDDE